MVGNHWLNSAKKKQLFNDIDELGVEVFSEGGTLGDFINCLNDEQTDLLMSMRIQDFVADPDELSFGMELVQP